jgi:glycolate oxidase subunit GlcD
MSSQVPLRELRAAVGARWLLTDPGSLLAYESDALTLFRCRPAAVVLPGSAEEVAACARALHAAHVPFAARGAGTGLSGGALVPEGGVILALSRMNRILALDPERRIARAEPGVVNADLSRAAAPHGLRFAPDPASQTVSTLGGNIAENAGGPMCFLHGSTGQHVLALDVVLADGRRETWGNPTAAPESLDLRGFCVGSEGTVALVVGATLRLLPLPEQIITLLAAFDSVQRACAAVSAVVAAGLRPVALEVMDQRAIRAVEASAYRAGLPTDAGAVLIVEIEGPAARVPGEAAETERVLRAHAPSRIERAETPAQRLAIWKGRKGAGGALGRLGPDSYVMDGVVPRARLAEIMRFVEEVEVESGLPVANLFHAGDGNIHPHFSYDARDPEQVARVERAGARILRKCLELGGSLSGEHGIGLEKQHLMREQFGAAELALMERVRRVFDSAELLNPGKGLPMRRGCAEAFHRHGRIAS